MAGNKIVSTLMKMVPARYHDVDPVAKTKNPSVIFILDDVTNDIHRWVMSHTMWKQLGSAERVFARDTLWNAAVEFFSPGRSASYHIIRAELKNVAKEGQSDRYFCGVASLRNHCVNHFIINGDGTIMEELGHPEYAFHYLPKDEMLELAMAAPIVVNELPAHPSNFNPNQHRIQVIR